MGPINLSLCYCKAFPALHFVALKLTGALVSYDDGNVLWIQPLITLYLKHLNQNCYCKKSIRYLKTNYIKLWNKFSHTFCKLDPFSVLEK
jgi:hypothetical protein